MSLEIAQVHIRPNTEIAWFIDTLPESHSDYIRTNYITPGKMTITRNESPDGLSLYVTYTFANIDDYVQFVNDEYFATVVAARTAYNEQHGIEHISY